MARKTIDKVVSRLLIFIMGLMVVNVLWQVFSRYILNSPSSFTDELARYLMIWLGILGAAYVSGQNKHMGIDAFTKKLSNETQIGLSKIVDVLIILFVMAVFIIGGVNLVYITATLDQTSAALHLPLAIVYLVIPISGVLIIYYKINDLTQQNK